MKKNHIIISVMMAISILSSLLLWGLMSQTRADVKITSIEKEVLNYGGKSNQVFSGFVLNQGNLKALNVKVVVFWLDMNNIEYVGFTELESLEPGESKRFSVVFPSDDLIMVSYYSQSVSFD